MSRLPDEAAAKEHQPTRGAVLSTLLETLALSPDESADLALQVRPTYLPTYLPSYLVTRSLSY